MNSSSTGIEIKGLLTRLVAHELEYESVTGASLETRDKSSREAESRQVLVLVDESTETQVGKPCFAYPDCEEYAKKVVSCYSSSGGAIEVLGNTMIASRDFLKAPGKWRLYSCGLCEMLQQDEGFDEEVVLRFTEETVKVN